MSGDTENYYCSLVEHESQGWTEQVTKTVGENVAHYRQRTTDERGRKLTAQGLADRCARLGLPIGRPAIAKLERGIRQSISLAEVLILAKALAVSPVVLMFPLGLQETVEVVPGELVDPLDAIYWAAGLDSGSPRADGTESALHLFMIHRQITDAMLGQRRLWQDLKPPPWKQPIGITEFTGDDLLEKMGLPPLPPEERLVKEFKHNATLLRTTRDVMRRQGLRPPPLPAGLEQVEGNGGRDGAR